MTEEEKQLLLADLCARLPYGVKVQPSGSASPHKFVGYDKNLVRIDTDQRFELENIKPYLRPMSSMTEEEKEELKKLFDAEEVTNDSLGFTEGGTLEDYISQVSYDFCGSVTDWLLAHHFDYRFPSLIEKSLALEAKEGMYEKK